MTKEMSIRKYRSMAYGAVLLLGLMMTLCTGRVSAADISPAPAAFTDNKYDMNGDGEMDVVYEISSAAQLYWFAGLVNGTLEEMPQDCSANAVLTKNITVNQYVLNKDKNVAEDADVSDFTAWTPIGTVDKPYQGKFDGLGHTVRGLYYDKASDYYVGFFGCMGALQDGDTASAAAINVHVRDSYFSAGQYTGGLCGYNNYGSISGSSFDGKVIGSGDVGGLCGLLTGTITQSYNKGDVVSSGDHAGGVCGKMINGGSYAVTSCYNTGSIRGGDYVGGICGYADNNTGAWYCYSTGTYEGNDKYTGGVCGVSSGYKNSYYLGTGTSGCTKEQFADGSVAWELASLTGNGIWGQTIGTDPGPVLFGETVYSGTDEAGNTIYHNHRDEALVDGRCTYCDRYVARPGQINGVYQISNKNELDWFSWYVGEGNTSVNAVLTADITYNEDLLTKLKNGSDGLNTWTPIGRGRYRRPYQGTFDGRNHTISGLYVTSPLEAQGLFYKLGANAVIKNVTVTDSYFKCGSSVGMICGASSGTIENCHSSGSVTGTYGAAGICGDNQGGTIRNCSNRAAVVSEYYAGGIAGKNSGSISRCSNSGTVEANTRYAGGISGIENDGGSISYCYNTGSISADNYVGGISGGYKVIISHSYNTGKVTPSREWMVGAIYAHDYDTSNNSSGSKVTNCYYLDTSCTLGDPSSSPQTETEFKNGEVTYSLNKNLETPAWFQNIDNGYEKDDYPSFTGGTVYYDETNKKYTNKYPGSHQFEYSAEGAVITEICTGTDNCGHTATATLKLDPGKNTIYTGNEITPAMVEYSSNWQGGVLTITYTDNTAISENGATASINKNKATATLSFSIRDHELFYATNGASIIERCYYCDHKATATLTIDSEADLTYTGNPIEPVILGYSEGWQGGTLELIYENHTFVTEQGATARITKGNVTAACTFMITKAGREAAPKVTVIPETIRGKDDGKLQGLTTDMEWSSDGKRYSTVTDQNMSFAKGTYYIRYQENENQSRSEAATVEFTEGTKLLSVKTSEEFPSSFTLRANQEDGYSWEDTVILTLSGPMDECLFTLKANGEELSPDPRTEPTENEENTCRYTIKGIQQDLTLTLDIDDNTAPLLYYQSGSSEVKLIFADYETEGAEVVLFYKNQTDFLFRIKDSLSETITAEYLLSDQNYAETEDISGTWLTMSSDENGLYRLSCTPGTKGYYYFRVTDENNNSRIVNIPRLVIYEDAVSRTEQITYRKSSGTDQSFSVDLKGNTVKAVYLGDTKVDPAVYTVSEDGTITLKYSWLETLAVETAPYQLRVEYDPQGEIYKELGQGVIDYLGIAYTNEAPKPTILNLTVESVPVVEDSKEPEVSLPAEKPSGPVESYDAAQTEKNSIQLDTDATVVWKNNKFTVTWGKVSDASGYEIYAAQFGKPLDEKALVKTVTGQKKTASFTKINGKKPVSNKVYKLIIKAYKLVGEEKVYIGTSNPCCVVRNDNSKYTNAAKVTVKKKSVTLKKGKAGRVEVSIIKQSKSRKLLGKSYGPSLRYYSTNTTIATVTSKGKIKAKAKGSCYIYVAALNGMHARVKVTVK